MYNCMYKTDLKKKHDQVFVICISIDTQGVYYKRVLLICRQHKRQNHAKRSSAAHIREFYNNNNNNNNNVA